MLSSSLAPWAGASVPGEPDTGGRVNSVTDLLSGISGTLGVPLALLQRVRGRWRFAGDSGNLPRPVSPALMSVAEEGPPRDPFWTALLSGDAPDWLLLVPGSREDWQERPGLAASLDRISTLASAMKQVQRRRAIERAGRIAYILGRRLSPLTDADRIYTEIVRAAARVSGAELATLALYAPEERALRIVSTFGYPHAIVEHLRLEPGEALIGRVYATRQPFFAGAGSGPQALPLRPRYRTESCIVVPVLADGLSLGVIGVADPHEADQFTRDDLVALQRIMPVASLALARQRTLRDMELLAIASRIDPVTRLANRQYLMPRLEAELERAQRLQQPLAMMLIDVDDFKRVNDTWGHLEGDHLLREIGALLSDNVRLFDVCTRYGGEEFAVLMPGAHEVVARQVSERVRQSVEDAFRAGSGGPKITLSAGVALYQPGDTAERLIGRADQALLTAKAQGKNAVRFAGGGEL